MNNDTTAAAAPVARALPPAVRPAPRWVSFATLGACALIPIVLCAFGYVERRDLQIERQESAKAREELKAEMQRHADAATKFRHVSSTEIGTTCSGLNGEMDCTFTNPSSTDAITVCVSGKVTNKKAPGVTLNSMMLCTGRIEPLATKHVSVPWQRGRAIDLCNSPGYGGTKQLDWDQCGFDYDDSPQSAKPTEWKVAL